MRVRRKVTKCDKNNKATRCTEQSRQSNKFSKRVTNRCPSLAAILAAPAALTHDVGWSFRVFFFSPFCRVIILLRLCGEMIRCVFMCVQSTVHSREQINRNIHFSELCAYLLHNGEHRSIDRFDAESQSRGCLSPMAREFDGNEKPQCDERKEDKTMRLRSASKQWLNVKYCPIIELLLLLNIVCCVLYMSLAFNYTLYWLAVLNIIWLSCIGMDSSRKETRCVRETEDVWRCKLNGLTASVDVALRCQ